MQLKRRVLKVCKVLKSLSIKKVLKKISTKILKSSALALTLTTTKVLVLSGLRVTSWALPSILVMGVLLHPVIALNRGVPVISKADHTAIHELFPNSTWDDLEPCGKYFDEQKELDTALQCVNTKVWPKSPLNSQSINPPRCFILKAGAPNVFSSPKMGFNFIPLFDIQGMGGVVGVYQPETKTIFVVENIDAALVYRHELQHFFLHLHDPITEGGGHHQPIWEQCEPPYYTPSLQVQVNAKMSN